MSRRLFCGIFIQLASALIAAEPSSQVAADFVAVELHEGIPNRESWEFDIPEAICRYNQRSMVFTGFPRKYTATGVIYERSNPFLLRARSNIEIASDRAGKYEFVLRSKSAARLFVDDKIVAQNKFLVRNANGHETVPELKGHDRDDLRPLPPGCQEDLVEVELSAGAHTIRLEAIVGGKGLRLELNELCVAWCVQGEKPHWLSSPDCPVPATEENWYAHTEQLNRQLGELNAANRKLASATWTAYWKRRHDYAKEMASTQPLDLPAKSELPELNEIDRFINQRLAAEKVDPAPLSDDLTFLRRLMLDTVGVIPTRDEIGQFLAEEPAARRTRAIEKLLGDDRWADHWVSYWQDVLAENPGILKPELNNTGPFRWWIHESLADNKPLDQFATELILMEGSVYHGGPAGFGLATQNDVPSAAKAHVLGKAFLAMDMNCARCHDAPYHPFKQEELFSLAAMLHRKPIKLPATSSVKQEPGGRVPLIKVSLKPDQSISPAWPFAKHWVDAVPENLVWKDANDPREQFALQLTAPQNARFAQVLANRIWHRLIGRGLIEPVDDWEANNAEKTHPELLQFLAHELVTHDYDMKHLAKLIFSSYAYQRSTASVDGSTQLFASAARRRLGAEQIVDSLLIISGKNPRAEQLTLDPEGRQPVDKFLNLGTPGRAWQFTSLSNERDRPALALPVAQSFVDALVAFGWRDSRQSPITVRNEEATALQPLTIANGVLGNRAVRLSDDSALTELSLQDLPVERLVEELFLRILTRTPTEDELKHCVELLKDGYELRRQTPPTEVVKKSIRRHAVSWSNHLNSEATKIKQELEREVLAGDPPTLRLQSEWRERMEDVAWALVNSPEFIFAP